MRRGLLLLSMVLFALAVVPAATANKPIRELVPGHDDVMFADQCPFPVLIHIEGGEINTTFTDKAGNPIRLLGVFPANTVTFTNLVTGASITAAATGSFQARLNRDGSTSFKVTGHGPFVPNPVTGESGIWYSSGRIVAEFDADGNPVSIDSTGKLVNMCDELAH